MRALDWAYAPIRVVVAALSVHSRLTTLEEKMTTMSQELETLITRVSEIENVADSAIALILDLKARLDAAIASGDMSALADLSTRLGAQTQELAQAILASTDQA